MPSLYDPSMIPNGTLKFHRLGVNSEYEDDYMALTYSDHQTTQEAANHLHSASVLVKIFAIHNVAVLNDSTVNMVFHNSRLSRT